MWDYVIEHNLLAKQDPYAWLLLKDDTIFTYAFFHDDLGKPFMYTAYQDAIANLHHSFTDIDPNRIIIVKASNQIGKSCVLCLKAIMLALTQENLNIIIMSKSLQQSQDLLFQMRHFLNNSKFADTWRENVGETANTTVLTFKREIVRNGKKIESVNRIRCAPVSEGTLGYAVYYLFLDEIDFYDNAQNFFWKVAYPRTLKTKGQIICFSNPNPDIAGVNSVLKQLWSGDLCKRKFSLNYLDAPWNNRTQYEIDQRNSPGYIFRSTHDGEFPDEGGAFFTESELNDMLQKEWTCRSLPAVDRQVYIGLDLGKMHDQTILTIGTTHKPDSKHDKYDDLDVVYVEEFKLGTEYDKIADRLEYVRDYYRNNYHGVAGIAFDETGQKTFGDFLKRRGVSAFGVDFSRKDTNKTLLYNDFKLMAEQRKIKVVWTPKVQKQLAGLEFKQLESKKLKTVEHKTESLLDDVCDSLAILIHIAVRPSKAPVGVVFVDDGSSSNTKDDAKGYKDPRGKEMVKATRDAILQPRKSMLAELGMTGRWY